MRRLASLLLIAAVVMLAIEDSALGLGITEFVYFGIMDVVITVGAFAAIIELQRR